MGRRAPLLLRLLLRRAVLLDRHGQYRAAMLKPEILKGVLRPEGETGLATGVGTMVPAGLLRRHPTAAMNWRTLSDKIRWKFFFFGGGHPGWGTLLWPGVQFVKTSTCMYVCMYSVYELRLHP